MRRIVVFSIVALFFITGCSKYPKEVEQVLKQAGNNRKELEIVLDYYRQKPGDSLKYRAACFLIENMAHHYSNDTTQLNKYRPVIEKIYTLRSNGVPIELIKAQVNPLLDSLISIYPLSNIYETSQKDINLIKSKLLINNIDNAFQVYQNHPFKDSILFEDFLKSVLPYRIDDGYCLEDWRSQFRQNALLRECITDVTNVHQFCDSILYKYKQIKVGWLVADRYPYLKLSDYMKSQVAQCSEKSWFNCLLLRSFGIPTVIDFVPVARAHESGHEWNAIKLKNGVYPFDPFWEESPRYLSAIYSGKVNHPKIGPINFPKIYRKTYELNINELLNYAINSKEEIPKFFLNPFQKDVTNEYLKSFSLKSPILINTKNNKYGYACVMGNNQTWIVVDYGKIDKKEITFNSLGPNIVYLPSIYEYYTQKPAGYPVVLTETGKQLHLNPDTTKRRTIKVSHVAFPREELKDYKESFIGVTIEGSNNQNFENYKILYKMKKAYEPGIHNIPINDSHKYRFVRISFPKIKIKLNEVKFLSLRNEKQEELKGSLISSYPKDNPIFQKLTDGKLITFMLLGEISEKHKLLDKIWFGFDFQEPKLISSFEFYFAFDSNIRKEGVYELQYWDFGWKSLGIKKSDSTAPISFENVPENALLMIKILDTQKYSRIFTYSNGKQNWY